MPKANIEKASNAIINPPTPEDPTSDVTRGDGSSGEPLHKPPMVDADGSPVTGETAEDVEGRTRTPGADKPAAVTAPTGRDGAHDGHGGPADQGADRWADDPMPEGAQERLEWAQRGTDTKERIDAALQAEDVRGSRKRGTLVNALKSLQQEHKRNERDNAQ